MTAYLINQLRICPSVSKPELRIYLEGMEQTFKPYGGRWLVIDTEIEILEGAWPGSVVLVEFPDLSTAKKWYRSTEFQDILHLRFNDVTSDLILVDPVRSHFTSDWDRPIRSLLEPSGHPSAHYQSDSPAAPVIGRRISSFYQFHLRKQLVMVIAVLLAVLGLLISTGTTSLACRPRHRPPRATDTSRSSSVIGRRSYWGLRKDLPDPCNDGHQPFFLANTEGQITDCICRRCTDSLPASPRVTWPNCEHSVVSGFINQHLRPKHAQMTEAAA